MDTPTLGEVSTGADGATVSIVTDIVLAGEIFPAASVVFAVMVCVPSAIAVDGTNKNDPPLAVVVPIVALSTRIVTDVPASAPPDIGGLLLLTNPPFVGEIMVGATGEIVSIVITLGELVGETFPAASLAEAVILCEPSVSGLVKVKE
jgi:hypothetical protein